MQSYHGIPNNVPISAIYSFDFQPSQAAYQRYKHNEISKIEYQQIENRYKIDSSQLYKGKIKQGLAVFSGVSNEKKILIFDLNSNNDFSDDIKYEFPLGSLKKFSFRDSVPTIKFTYEYYTSKKQIVKRTRHVKILPFHPGFNFSDSLDKKLQVLISLDEHKEGYFRVGDTDYRIVLPDGRYLGSYSFQNTVYLAKKGGENITFFPELLDGDHFTLQNTRFHIVSISEFGDTVKIVKFGNLSEKIIGYREGDYMNLPVVYELFSKTPINFSSKPYILFDFWGTWCKPCIEGLPHLLSFYEKYKEKVQIISVANDSEEDKVRRFVEKNQMVWKHIFENRNNPEQNNNSLITQFNVDCYPSFILLNAERKIIIRTCGKDALKQVEDAIK